MNPYSEFEKIKHVDENEIEFWSARDLQEALQYSEWRNFLKVIEKAKIACENSNIDTLDHFVEVNKMVTIGVSTRQIEDINLSRYACYLIVQNGDARKDIIATGQTYFAVQTRKQELNDMYAELSEEQKRLSIRNELSEHNKSLAEAAKDAGVKEPRDYAIFQNKGYQGLYGGMNANDIKAKKGLRTKDKILDHMGSTELAANLFRATQTDEKLRRDKVKGVTNANNVHYEVGAKVRATIKDLGGTMPEDLPKPLKDIKKIEKEIQKKLK